MMGKLWVGVDNGSAGTIGFITDMGWYDLVRMPHKFVQDYQKTVTEVCRVDHEALRQFMLQNIATAKVDNPGEVRVLIERPFTMQYAFKAMMSGRRALEAVLIVLEQMHIGYQFIDSKEWQRTLLPKPPIPKLSTKRQKKLDLKKLSWQVGQRFFPTIDEKLFSDFDGLLIAEWCRRRECHQ